MCGGAAVVRRRSSGGSVVEQGRFLLSLHACLCVFKDNGRKRKEKELKRRELEKEIEREVLEVKKKKGEERMRCMGIRVWCRKNKRKKKRKHMDERMEILPQYCYNIFTINFK